MKARVAGWWLALAVGCASSPPTKTPPPRPSHTVSVLPRSWLVPTPATGAAVLAAARTGAVRVEQRVDGLAVVCPDVHGPLGPEAYGHLPLPEPEWLALDELTPAELAENLETPTASAAERLRVTHRLVLRSTSDPFCADATHDVVQIDADTGPDGALVVRRIVLQPVGGGGRVCRAGFHPASSLPLLCVQRAPFTCTNAPADCVAQCEAGDGGSCEVAAKSKAWPPGNTAARVLARRACELDPKSCCRFAVLSVDTAVPKPLVEAIDRACAAGLSLCCLARGVTLSNAKDPAGAGEAYGHGCEVDFGLCQLAARAYRNANDLDRARRFAGIGCRGGVTQACVLLRELTLGLPPSP